MRTTEPLGSTAISSVTYDPEQQEPQDIDITFASGRTYSFHNVPLTVVQGLVNAPSAGRYFASNIKGKYDV